MQSEIRIIPLRGIGEIQPGDQVDAVILAALKAQGLALEAGDVVVVTQKIVSKAEGRVVSPEGVEPSHMARMAAAQGHKDASYYEVVLREARRIVKMDRGVLVTETHHGFICANSGVDESNVDGGTHVTLLPVDPDASARRPSRMPRAALDLDVAVIISDSFGRPWREGQTNIAIGAAGIEPLSNYAGQHDSSGYLLRASNLAVADELASAAELVMGKIDAVPVAVIRGYAYAASDVGALPLVRAPERDLFR